MSNTTTLIPCFGSQALTAGVATDSWCKMFWKMSWSNRSTAIWSQLGVNWFHKFPASSNEATTSFWESCLRAETLSIAKKLKLLTTVKEKHSYKNLDSLKSTCLYFCYCPHLCYFAQSFELSCHHSIRQLVSPMKNSAPPSAKSAGGSRIDECLDLQLSEGSFADVAFGSPTECPINLQ